MNHQYYVNLLGQARKAVVQKRRAKLACEVDVIFLQDNAPVHTARVAREALKATGFTEIDQPTHSPDVTSSAVFFRGRRLSDDNEMKAAGKKPF